VSPFIVTTTRPAREIKWPETRCVLGYEILPETVSQLAVATLEEAKAESAALLEGHEYTNDEFFATALIPESGGTVGPLPDGTTIQVEPIQRTELAAHTGCTVVQWMCSTDDELVAAFNAKHGSRPSKCGPPGSAERGAVG
jgi:hypothetical protein